MNSEWEKGYWTGAGNSPWAEAGRIDRKNEEDSRRKQDARMAAIFADREREKKQRQQRNEAEQRRQREDAAKRDAERKEDEARLAAEAEAARAKEAARRASLTPEQRAEEDRIIAARRAEQARIDAEFKKTIEQFILTFGKIAILLIIVLYTSFILFNSFIRYSLLFSDNIYLIKYFGTEIAFLIMIFSLFISIPAVFGLFSIIHNGYDAIAGIGIISSISFIFGIILFLIGDRLMSSIGIIGAIHIALTFGLLPAGWRAIRS